MKRSTVTSLIAGLLAAAPHARADLSYSYVEGLWTTTEAATVIGEEDASGPELNASYEILSFLHVFAGYRTVELDDVSLETEMAWAGVGFNWDFSDRQSVFFNLSGIDAESDSVIGLGPIGLDDSGYGYSIGYRESNNERLEFTVSADHIELDDTDFSDTSISMSLQYRITPKLRIVGGVNFAGEDAFAKLGVRYYLPNRLDRAAAR
jgi:hypothetical protein